MKINWITLVLIAVVMTSCNATKEESYSDVKIAGAMRNVMWKGELEGIIALDTIGTKKGLYGIGPLSYLRGEILIRDGQAYVSKVLTDSTMIIERTFDASAPFLVYANVEEWEETDLPATIKTIKDLESYLDTRTKSAKRPFAFNLKGKALSARIHIQNLPEGSKVSSPEEAHQGQVSYTLQNEEIEIVGFFSTEHQGVFTHHDTFLHMHLISEDETMMGHLDAIEMGDMKLYLPLS